MPIFGCFFCFREIRLLRSCFRIMEPGRITLIILFMAAVVMPIKSEDVEVAEVAEAEVEKCATVVQNQPQFLDVSPFFRLAPSRFQSQQILFLSEFSRFMNRQAPNMLKDFVDKKKIYQAERTLQKLKRYNVKDFLAATSEAEEEEDDGLDFDDGDDEFYDEDSDPKARFLMSPSITNPFLAFGEAKKRIESGRMIPASMSKDQEQMLLEFLLSSTEEAIDMAKEIVKAVEHSMDKYDATAPDFWETACKSEWWPFDDKTCVEIRCTACAPAVMSAAAVCDTLNPVEAEGKEAEAAVRPKRRSHRCMQRVMSEGFCNYCIVEFLEEA